jgi:hypothetical protein
LDIDHPAIVEELGEIQANHEYETALGKASYIDCFKGNLGKRLATVRKTMGREVSGTSRQATSRKERQSSKSAEPSKAVYEQLFCLGYCLLVAA